MSLTRFSGKFTRRKTSIFCFDSLRPLRWLPQAWLVHVDTHRQRATRLHYKSTPSKPEKPAGTLPVYKYPSTLNIYDSGNVPQMFMGSIRVVTMATFAVGNFYYVPSCALDPSVPWWVAPTAAIGSTIPLATTVIAFVPFIHHIYVLLPDAARRDKPALMAFANDPPRDTKLLVKRQRFWPWPTSRGYLYGDLRKLPASWFRLANLEWQPPNVRKSLGEINSTRSRPSGVLSWLIQQWIGRLYVGRGQKDRSLVPGVWDRMWEQIPMAGESAERTYSDTVKTAATPSKKRRLGALQNRSAPIGKHSPPRSNR